MTSSTDQDDLVRRIGDEVDRRLAHNSARDVLGLRHDLKTRYRVLYIALAFLGSTLCWYAVWKVITMVPVLRDPPVALGIGIVLLGVTAGYRKTLL